MAIQGNFKIGGKSFAKKSGSASPKKKIKEFKGGDSRGNYLTNQAFRQQQADDAAMQAALTNRASIKLSAGKGIINPSDFKGGSARLPGESGEDYRKFMVGLRGLNTDAFDKAFPFSSGAALRSASQFMPGGGVLSLLADIGNKIKGGLTRATDIFMPNQDEVVGGTNRPGPYDASGLAGYRDAIMRNLEPTMSTKGFTPRQQLDAIRSFSVPGTGLFPVFDSYGVMPTTPEGVAQFNEIVEQSKTPPNIDVTLDVLDQQNIDPLQAAKDQQDKMMQMYGPREPQGPSGLAYGFPSQFQEGGLASINNPEYNMRMNEPPYSNVFMNYADGGIASLYD